MMLLFRFWHRGVLPVLLLLAGSAAAQQQQTGPLSADPDRARYAPTLASRVAQHRTAALSLPFFDDFANPVEGAPRADLWVQTGGTLVSNRFAINPPTRGAATFDALKADGTSYTYTVSTGGTSTTTTYSGLDTLTSMPINLAGFAAADSVYLSFALQIGSIIGRPSSSSSSGSVYFDVQFRTNTGRWTSAPGRWPLPTSLTSPRAFRQLLVPITQAQYLHGTFQFRFLAYGHSDFSFDNWSVDYVRLDRNRTRGNPSAIPQILGDTITQDVAISNGFDTITTAGLSNPLRRFTGMPVWQYNAAPAGSELNPSMGVQAQNLNLPPLPLPTPWVGTVRDLATGTVLGEWGNTTTLLTTRPSRLTQLNGDATLVPIPLTPEHKRLRYTLALSSRETDARTLPNDTISREVELNDYYSYDDGTAEGVYFLSIRANGVPPNIAYRFDTNQPDQVKSIRLRPIFGRDRIARTVFIRVWANNNGRPADIPLASKTVTLAPVSGPVELFFDTPVPVSGTFFVGFGQPVLASQTVREYATDLNNRIPANYAWATDVAGVWEAADNLEEFSRTVIMIQPVMNNNVLSSSAPITRDAAAFRLYPNPSRGSVSIEGPAFARATVLDALGRTVWEQPAAQAGQRQLELGTLPTGVYIVRLALPDSSTATRRLVIDN